MMAARALIAAACLAALPAIAQAEGFFDRDLGDGGAPAECMDRAERTLNAYVRASGSTDGFIARGSWSVDGYHLEPGNIAVQFLCPYRDSHVSVAILVGHSDATGDAAEPVVSALAQIWDNNGMSNGK